MGAEAGVEVELALDSYTYRVGPLTHVPPQTKDKRFLRIPSGGYHDEPLHPEQAELVRELLRREGIAAEEIWFSTWEFASPREAQRFVDLLKRRGATETD